MTLFYLLMTGMLLIALIPVALSDPQFFPVQQTPASTSTILAGIESSLLSEPIMYISGTPKMAIQADTALMAEAEGEQRYSKTISFPSDQGQALRSAV